MADLATYQAAANSIYDPQQTNEAASLAATNKANVANLQGQKGQINTDYGQAVQNLNQTTQQNTGQINQLYTQRLGGNFSGLQGNDLGQMFSRAAQDQTNIETNRANKLNNINTQVSNANNIYNTANNSLVGKYSALKNQYANTALAADQKAQQDNYYKQANLQLAQQRNGIAASQAAAGTSAQRLSGITSQIGQALQRAAGRDGYVSPQDYAAARKDFINQGYGSGQFDKAYSNYRNPYAEDAGNGKTRSLADYAVG